MMAPARVGHRIGEPVLGFGKQMKEGLWLSDLAEHEASP